MNRPLPRSCLVDATLEVIAGCDTLKGKLPTYLTAGTVLLKGRLAVGAYVVLQLRFAYDNDADPPSGAVKEGGIFTLSTYGAPAGSYKFAILPPADFDEGFRFGPRKWKGPTLTMSRRRRRRPRASRSPSRRVAMSLLRSNWSERADRSVAWGPAILLEWDALIRVPGRGLADALDPPRDDPRRRPEGP